MKLNQKNLHALPGTVAIPAYDRSKVSHGIVHIGVGGFHRAHEAFYTDQVLHHPGTASWGICGVGLLDSDRKIVDVLAHQDGLYTVLIGQPDGSFTARVIGSITEYLLAPDNACAVMDKMADPACKIITLTITEGGYNIDSATGEFLLHEPAIQWDLHHPVHPRTVFGYLTRALKLRRDRGTGGMTLQSCDNIQKNGAVLKKALLAYVQAAEPGLIRWIEEHVAFPNSMVDRITPVTTPADIEKLRNVYGIEDAWPVVCEPFMQWVIEDRFASGRPDWELAGAQFVKDVEAYEKMKLRLLNAGHSLLGFLGTLYGCITVDEAVNVPMLRKFLREFMDREVTPVLGHIEGINLEDYKDSLIQRFVNPNIKDQLSRICLESSAKIPKFLLPTIREQLAIGGPVSRSALVVAAWCRYLELSGTPGNTYPIRDQMKDILFEQAMAAITRDPLAFLRIEAVFGDLARNERFVKIYLHIINYLRGNGVDKAIHNLDRIIPLSH